MAYIGELFLKVKLQGLGWDSDPEAKHAYEKLMQNIADYVQKDENLASDGANKTVRVAICQELGNGSEPIHSIEGLGLIVQQKGKIPLEGRYSR